MHICAVSHVENYIELYEVYHSLRVLCTCKLNSFSAERKVLAIYIEATLNNFIEGCNCSQVYGL